MNGPHDAVRPAEALSTVKVPDTARHRTRLSRYAAVATSKWVREPVPLAQAATELFTELLPTLSSARKAARRGLLLVDGAIGKNLTVVQPGQALAMLQRCEGLPQMDPRKAPARIEVVYEDAHLAVVVKPQGMATQPVRGEYDTCPSLDTCLPYWLSPSGEMGALARPRYVHRLDAPTGGLVLVGKTAPALASLSAAFAERRVSKRYAAVVRGRLAGSGTLEAPLGGAACRTRYEARLSAQSSEHGWLTLVDLYPLTGRKHQLRRHMALLGFPILGDGRYTHGYAQLADRGPAWEAIRDSARAAKEGDSAEAGERGLDSAAEEILNASGCALQDLCVPGARVGDSSEASLRSTGDRGAAILGGCVAAARDVAHKGADTEGAVIDAAAALQCSQAMHMMEPAAAPGMGCAAVSSCIPVAVGVPSQTTDQRRISGWDTVATLPEPSNSSVSCTAGDTPPADAWIDSLPNATPGQDQLCAEGKVRDIPRDHHANDLLSCSVEGEGDSESLADSAAVPLCLWAVQLEFMHPSTGKPVLCCIENPSYFGELMSSNSV